MPTIPQNTPTHKYCSQCEQTLPVIRFSKSIRANDGLAVWCKECSAAHNRAYRESNKERLKQKRVERIEQDRERIQEIRRAQYLRRRDHILEQKRDYYQENHEERSTFNRLWAKLNPEKHRSYYHAREARKRGNGGRYTAEQWEALRARYGYTCLRCGKREPEIKLTVDHVIPIELGGSNDISNLQPLCRICNSAKGCRIIDYRE